jgi:hypothetical protein
MVTPDWNNTLIISIPANGKVTLSWRMSGTLRQNGLWLYRSRLDIGPQNLITHSGTENTDSGNYECVNETAAALLWYVASWERIAGDASDDFFPNLRHQSTFWGNPNSAGIFFSTNIGGGGSGVGLGAPDVTSAVYYL